MTKTKNMKKLLSLLLSAIMLLSTVSVGIFAFAEDGDTEEPTKTFNYVAIGDDIAAGINTDEENKSYATLIKEDYEGKGYTVNYSNYSQSYYGSNEIRKNLAIDGYNVPEKFGQANAFVEWSYASDAGLGWNKEGNPTEDIKNADLITINMGTNDFAFYTLFRVLDKMKFQIPDYPTSLMGMIDFVGLETSGFLGIPTGNLDYNKGCAKEGHENPNVQRIIETINEIKAFKAKSNLEVALLNLQFVAPDSIQTENELKTAEMQVKAVEDLMEAGTAMFNFDSLTGHANLEKQRTEIEWYNERKSRAKKIADAEKAISQLQFTEVGSIKDKDMRGRAENEVSYAKRQADAVAYFMDVTELEGYEKIPLQEKEIENFDIRQEEIEREIFIENIAKLTYTEESKIQGFDDLAAATKQIEDIKSVISKFEKIDLENEPGYEKITDQEQAIADWKEHHAEEIENEKNRKKLKKDIENSIEYLSWGDKDDVIPVYTSGFWRPKKDYKENWVRAGKQIKDIEEQIATYEELYGNGEFNTERVNNQRENRREYAIKYKKELADAGVNVDENGDEIIVPEPEPEPEPENTRRFSLFSLTGEQQKKLRDAEEDEDKAKEDEEAAKQLEEDIDAAERALSKLTYFENGSIRSENFLEAAEKQYEEAKKAIEKIDDDEIKENLEGYEKYKKQGAVIEHYKNGEWHKNAEKIQNENLAYSYRKTALTANAVGLGKDMAYLFASASKEVAKNYVKNYKGILKSINRINPNAEVIVIGLHNPLKNVAPGDISSLMGKAVDAVNDAIFGKTGWHFDVSTVFYDGGIGSLFRQGDQFVKHKITTVVTAVTTKIKTAVNNVIETVKENIQRISFFNKGKKPVKPVEPVEPEEPEEEKTEAEIHEEQNALNEEALIKQ